MGDATLQDTILSDGLTDAFYNYHMGVTGNLLKQTTFIRFYSSRAIELVLLVFLW